MMSSERNSATCEGSRLPNRLGELEKVDGKGWISEGDELRDGDYFTLAVVTGLICETAWNEVLVIFHGKK